jgi:prophage regulatory protein
MSLDEGFYSKKQLREIVLLSPTQIDRLEKAGKFPKRVRLGPYRTSRVGWLKREVHAWCKQREEARRRGS